MNFKLAVSFIGLVLALATPRSALAQLEKSLSITSQYDDNAFGNFQKLSDYVTQLSLNLSGDYDKDYSVWTVSYVGNLNLFNKHAFRNYHAHTFSIHIGYLPYRYGRPAYSLPDTLGHAVELSSSRKDQKFELNVELEKVFKFTNGFARTLALQVGYYFLNNRSNDDFYRFTNNMISVGISTDF